MKMQLIKLSHYLRKFTFFQAVVLFFKVEILKVQHLQFKGVNIYLRKGTSDHIVFFQVMVYESYEFAKKWRGVNVVIDAGANIGISTCYFSTLFPSAKILSIEPESGNFSQLIKNTDSLENVKPLMKALWKNDGVLIIDGTSNETWSFKVKEDDEAHGNESASQIDAVSIDALVSQFDLECIDLLKIDIEGAEYDLFLENYKSWLPRVKYIMIELHDGYKKGCSTTVMKALANFNFSIQLTRKEIIVFINNDLV